LSDDASHEFMVREVHGMSRVWRASRRLPVANHHNWPVAGVPVGEIDDTLLAFDNRSERPTRSEQLLEPVVLGRAFRVVHDRQLWSNKP
jgi:hypothetical protein